jgi:hypothetical protein
MSRKTSTLAAVVDSDEPLDIVDLADFADEIKRLASVNTRHLVASYLAAERQHREAARSMEHSEQLFDELVERGIDEDTAWARAGVHLADIRSVRAYQKMTRALRLLNAL